MLGKFEERNLSKVKCEAHVKRERERETEKRKGKQSKRVLERIEGVFIGENQRRE